MPRIVSDIVDVYVFRRVNSNVQFLILRRRADVALGNTWQAIHGSIEPGEKAVDAALRELEEHTGFAPERFYSADFINQFYDHQSDTVVLAPTFAARVSNNAKPRLSSEYSDYAWCDLDETIGRLLWSGQRWAARHIFDVIAMNNEEAEFYALS